MTTPASTSGPVALSGISIRVSGPNGFSTEHELPPGDALVVGSSPACGVRIEGPGIAPMHCTLSCEEGQLVVDDWDTGAGTYLNGERIARQATAQPGAAVSIGDYRLETDSAAAALLGESAGSSAAVEYDATDAVEDTDPFLRTYESPTNAGEPHGHDWDRAGDGATDHAGDENNVETPPFAANALDVDTEDADAYAYDVYDPTDDDDAAYERYDEPAYAAPEQVGSDDVDELLQIELEYLRAELAERDARVTELERTLESGGAALDDDLPSREEVDTLVGRLEQLLEELDHSDERLKTMAELLRLSEEANAASVEERAQMESWMGEVERRVGNWEGEWHAERDTLNRHIAELTAQRDEAESRGGSRENSELIHKLRQQIGRLEAETQQLQSERTGLQQRMETASVSSVEQQVQHSIDEALREERLELSQERAELARERAALMKQQEELTAQPSSHTSSADVADLKIRAFREHLREIRANEPDDRPAPSMSQRLGKLWRKIDGRPLDTD